MKTSFYLCCLFVLLVTCKDNYKIEKEYHDNGTIKAIRSYKNGELDGKTIYYYPNGGIESIQNFVNGKFDGDVIFYYENGSLHAKGQISENKEVGKWIYYHQNGKTKAIHEYSNNKMINTNAWDWYGNSTCIDGNGYIIYYFDSINIKSKFFLKNNLRDGCSFELNNRGDTVSITQFNKGTFVEHKTFD